MLESGSWGHSVLQIPVLVVFCCCFYFIYFFTVREAKKDVFHVQSLNSTKSMYDHVCTYICLYVYKSNYANVSTYVRIYVFMHGQLPFTVH